MVSAIEAKWLNRVIGALVLVLALCWPVAGAVAGAKSESESEAVSPDAFIDSELNIDLNATTFLNEGIQREINLGGSYIRETVFLDLRNIGSSPQDTYYYLVDGDYFDHLSLSEAVEKPSNGPVFCEPVVSKKFGLTFIKLKLPKVLAPGETTKVSFVAVFTNVLKALPEEIKLGEIPHLLLTAYKLPYSLYPTSKSGLQVSGIPPSAKELQLSALDTPKEFLGRQVEDNLVFGVFNNIPPFTKVPLFLHYERNSPLPFVDSLKRELWYSHWGSTLSVEEHYNLTNTAAGLKDNVFSRIDWQKGHYAYQASPAITRLDIVIGSAVREPYFTDLVGNVSTSNFINLSSSKALLTLKPRFPVFGGWNYNFTVGWSSDLSLSLRKTEKDTYITKVPLLESINDISYGKVQLSFLLPEGAEVVSFSSPILPKNSYITKRKSYLDTKGHTELVLEYENLIDDHARAEVYVVYKLTSDSLLFKPLYVAGLFFTVFLAIIVLIKFDISLK